MAQDWRVVCTDRGASTRRFPPACPAGCAARRRTRRRSSPSGTPRSRRATTPTRRRRPPRRPWRSSSTPTAASSPSRSRPTTCPSSSAPPRGRSRSTSSRARSATGCRRCGPPWAPGLRHEQGRLDARRHAEARPAARGPPRAARVLRRQPRGRPRDVEPRRPPRLGVLRRPAPPLHRRHGHAPAHGQRLLLLRRPPAAHRGQAAGPSGPSGHMVGQPDHRGIVAVSPWVVPDELPGEGLAERRRRLGAAGRALAPGSGVPCADPTRPGRARTGTSRASCGATSRWPAPRACGPRGCRAPARGSRARRRHSALRARSATRRSRCAGAAPSWPSRSAVGTATRSCSCAARRREDLEPARAADGPPAGAHDEWWPSVALGPGGG
jgi:hypothetical protein